MADKTIGILTGGGDVPGLNAVIKSVVYGATAQPGYRVIGIRRGWAGLTHPNLDQGFDEEYLLRLNRANTRTVDRTGGTRPAAALSGPECPCPYRKFRPR